MRPRRIFDSLIFKRRLDMFLLTDLLTYKLNQAYECMSVVLMFNSCCGREPCLTDRAAANDDRWFIEQSINDVNHSVGHPEIATHQSSAPSQSANTKHQLFALRSDTDKQKLRQCSSTFICSPLVLTVLPVISAIHLRYRFSHADNLLRSYSCIRSKFHQKILSAGGLPMKKL